MMTWKEILILILLIIALISSYITLVLGYIKYRQEIRGKSVGKNFNRAFFIFLTVGILFFLLWGFSRNLTTPFL